MTAAELEEEGLEPCAEGRFAFRYFKHDDLGCFSLCDSLELLNAEMHVRSKLLQQVGVASSGRAPQFNFAVASAAVGTEARDGREHQSRHC